MMNRTNASRMANQLKRILKKTLFNDVIKNKRMFSNREDTALYVHWPFCAKMCPYCDFNKFIRRNEDVDVMIGCLQEELKYFIKAYHVNKIKTVYFGGGTPSLAPPHLISSILETIEQNSKLAESAEITLEVNPTSIENDKLRLFQEHGINRVSIGVQALNNADLELLGRQHTKEQALKCFEKAIQLFDGRVSIDLMFGRPQQTLEQWISELKEVVRLNCRHLSLYQLTMKKHTPMERQHRRGILQLPSEDCLAEMYETTVEILKQHGLERYEVSNFASKGQESQHNLCYWNGNDYIGIGPGAHGRLTAVKLQHNQFKDGGEFRVRHAFLQTLIPKQWIKKVMQIGHGVQDHKILTTQESIEEMILLGLRTVHGIPRKRFERITGTIFNKLHRHPSFKDLIDADFIVMDQKSIRATSKGFSFLDSITREVICSLD